ncbi:NAD(P)-binding protein, partial [Bordetella pertussis]
MKVAVIGAGWAGLAASVALREADAKVTVFEAGRTPGGR